jgi:hypothetical protein
MGTKRKQVNSDAFNKKVLETSPFRLAGLLFACLPFSHKSLFHI